MITAAGKAFGGNALKGVKEAAAGDNKEAGKLFAGNGNGNADAAAIGKAASAVTAVSGEQILKAIVEAAGAGNQAGATAGAATNPIEAAIGTDGDQAAFGDNGMKKSDKIAAAIVLRGVAKDGKFAAANNANVKSAVGEVSKWLGEMITAAGDAAKGGTGGANEKIGDVGAANKGAKAEANSVKEIAKGIKGIVDAAGKAFGGNALTGVKEAAAGDENGANADAGKLFATQAAAGAGADVAKAASAVTAVSGEQILKAIVDAAGDTANQAGAGANAATNPIAAAIGADGAGAAFNQDEMKKSDKIAAAIVLRGVAKDGKFAAADNDNSKASVKSAVGEVSKWLGEMITAAGEAAKGGTGGANEKIGDAANNGAKADADSVKEIAKGIKGIVDAAGKAFGKDDALTGVTAAADEANAEAGKLFAGNNGAGNAAGAAIGKAASAVTAVSGEQILKAIVEAAGADKANQVGATAGDATNPIAAAIGTDGAGAAFGQDDMKKSDKIAAAIVLRGVAKDGKFAADAANNANVKSAVDEVSKWLEEMITAAGEAAKGGTGEASEKIGDVGAGNGHGAKADADSVKEIAKGIKGIVDAAGKAFGGNALKDVTAAAGDENGANADAGKLFAGNGDGNAAVAVADIAKAAAAVTAVSGEQILKAIVEAAGAGDQVGVAAAQAKNPIAAAIGTDNDGAAAFGENEMKKRNDKIAAAIVLRGVAKSGKFAAANDNDNSKASVKSAVDEVSKWLEEMITAASDAATKGGTGEASEKIGDSDANKGAVADADSVKGIAKGIKGIVDAAGKAFGKDGNALTGVTAAAGEANKDAGKLFAGANAAGAGDAADIAKAASAVTAVSGEQILKAIVDAAGAANQAGASANAAANPIAAAIGAADDAGVAFSENEMKKRNDKIAAAIVLRGVAKDGKFAVANAAGNNANVKSAVDEVSKWLGEMIKAAGDAAKGGTGGADKIGDVGAANKGAIADANSVKEIAKGIKGIVDAAGKAFGKDGDALKDVKAAADDEDNKDAGKLFAGKAGAGAGADEIAKAASAVTAVSGEQILKAIVDAAGDAANQAGVAAGDAANPIAAAIGTDADGAANGFGDAEMKKSDKIAAAIVLRGVAKSGKFAVANAAGNNKASVKSAVESAVGEVSKWLEEMIKAADEAATKGGTGTGGGDKIGDVGANNKGAVADENSVNGIAKGIKGIVMAAGKAFGKDGALKGVAAAADGDDNAEAGKLFAGKDGNGAGAVVVADIAKAASAVTAVSGEQILKAIVEAAGAGEADQVGKKAADATNPIAAAIGTDNDGAAFGENGMKKSDKIAAAIVLRGVAKDGKFAVANAADDDKKASVKSAVGEVSKWLEEMIKAAGDAATKGGTGGADEKIGGGCWC